MKFLVDECTGIWVSRKLRQMGFDSVSVIECMKGALDEEIIQRAVEDNRVIITRKVSKKAPDFSRGECQ